MSSAPTLFGVTIAVFMFVHVLPGDPARLMAGIQATEDSVQLVRASLGLDKPLWVQYGIYFKDLIHGNLGVSNRDAVSVSTHVAQAFGPTFSLTLAAMLDYPVIQGVVLVFALEFVAVNLLVDVLYARIDPRIRYH